jgi:hypothetical protein
VLSQQHDEAGGSPIRETPVRAASSPDNAGTDQHHRMVRVRQARQEGVREEPALTLLKSPASSNPVDLGWYAMRTNMNLVLGTSRRVKVARFGGHGESLRRSRGDIAGA